MNKFELDLINRYKNMILSSKLQNYTMEDNSTTLLEYFTVKKSNKIKGNFQQFMSELLNHYFGNKMIIPIDFIINNRELLKTKYGNCNAISGGSYYNYVPMIKYIDWLDNELNDDTIIMTNYYRPSFFSRFCKNVYYNTDTKTYEIVYIKDDIEKSKLQEFKQLFENNKEYYDKQELSKYDELLDLIKKEAV